MFSVYGRNNTHIITTDIWYHATSAANGLYINSGYARIEDKNGKILSEIGIEMI